MEREEFQGAAPEAQWGALWWLGVYHWVWGAVHFAFGLGALIVPLTLSSSSQTMRLGNGSPPASPESRVPDEGLQQMMDWLEIGLPLMVVALAVHCLICGGLCSWTAWRLQHRKGLGLAIVTGLVCLLTPWGWGVSLVTFASLARPSVRREFV